MFTLHQSVFETEPTLPRPCSGPQGETASVDKPLIFGFDSSLSCVLLPDSKILFKAGGPRILALRIYWRKYPPQAPPCHTLELPGITSSSMRRCGVPGDIWEAWGSGILPGHPTCRVKMFQYLINIELNVSPAHSLLTFGERTEALGWTKPVQDHPLIFG